jgi:glycosyltransferase involved in cell wall biosynthesis
LVNQYPAPSHTFIRREIQSIEALGETVFRYALRCGTSLVDSKDKDEQRRTFYILGRPAEMILRSLEMLAVKPLAMCRTLLLAFRLGWRSDRTVLRHLVYFAEAAVLASRCRQDRVDHIHAHFGTNPAAVAMLACRISGIPYSFTVHGPEEFDKAPLIGLKEKIRNCAFVVAISSYGRSQLYRCVDQQTWAKIKVVRCGIEPELFKAANAPAINALRFVCVGRLSPQKGHLLLIEAVRRLAQTRKDFDVVLCGDGEARHEIEAAIARHDLQTNIRVLGWVDGTQVREEISNASALVLPSFAEGLPVVIMEAMALKRPVISTFIAGIPELVVSGENGWLVPAGDVEALTLAMQACLDANAETLARMGHAGHERALLRHDINAEARKLIRLFEGVLRQGDQGTT